MPSCRDIVTGALKKIGRLAAGRGIRQPDLDDGMTELVSLYHSWIEDGVFGRLSEVVPTGNYTARGNERIFRAGDTVSQITLPELVTNSLSSVWDYGFCARARVLSWVMVGGNQVLQETDQADVADNVSPPRDLSVVVIHDASIPRPLEYIYDGTLKKWMSLHDLTSDGDAPLSWRNTAGLQASLAVRVAEMFGVAPGQFTVAQARSFENSLAMRWGTTRRELVGEYF